MARMRYLDREEIPEQFRSVFDRNAGQDGKTLNLYLLLG